MCSMTWAEFKLYVLLLSNYMYFYVIISFVKVKHSLGGFLVGHNKENLFRFWTVVGTAGTF